MEKTTATEFIEWMIFLNMELERTSKEDYLFASIALEVRRGNVKNPNKVRIEDVLVKMKATSPEVEDFEELEEDEEYELKKKVSKKSRSFWNFFLGIKKDR